MSEKLITIATFYQEIEARLSKVKLGSEGIESFIIDKYLVTMDWLYPNSGSGVKLQVKESDVQRAIEILQQEPLSTALEDSKF
jgi:hypothetical protein